MEADPVLESCWEIREVIAEPFDFDRRVPRPSSRQPSTRLRTPSPARRPTGNPVVARRRTSCGATVWGAGKATGAATELGPKPPEATELWRAVEQPEATEWSMATEQPEATEPSWAKPDPDTTPVGSATPGPFPTPPPEPPWPVVAGPNAGGVGAAVARAASSGAGSLGVAWRVWAPPVEPVAPESPERAVGVNEAVELAGPVSPVLVAEDWLRVWPESPVRAVGVTVAFTSAPAPLSVSARGSGKACDVPTACVPAMVLEALPPGPGTALEAPPRLPCPPVSTRRVSLTASPVVPDVATALPRAPLLASDRAVPPAEAFPVPPESPEAALLPPASPVPPDEPDNATGLAE